MVSLETLPIIELNNDNYIKEWPSLLDSIRKSLFICIDLEMSGLGDDRRQLTKTSIEDRYKLMCEMASNYSILSIGISCFIESTKTLINKKEIKVFNKTFNLLTISSNHFMVDPNSINFLIKNGVDMNELFTKAIRYYKGNDIENKKVTKIK
jgi:hypothetical protein